MNNNLKKGDTLAGKIAKNKVSYIMTGPFFILFLVFTVVPVLLSIGLSMTTFNGFQIPKFVLFENYRRLFVNDEVFIKALKNTALFAVITGPLSYAACFLLAWIINDLKPWVRAIFTTIFYAPSISGSVYMIWQIMFSSDTYGYMNSVLMSLGFIDRPIYWLENSATVLWVCMIVQLWLSLGTSFLAFIAGFQGVDRSLYEAAAVDGITNRWQELWFITLPTMKPQLLFASVMQITASLGVGDITANMAGLPSIDYAAHTVVNHIVDYGSSRYEMGYASAVATILFVIMVSGNKLVQSLIKKVGN